MFFLYNLLLPILFIFYLPFYLVHIFKRGGLTVDFWERFGFFPSAVKARLQSLGRPPVWIHAVSIGEAVAAATFIDHWRRRDPALPIVFSCGTSTGFATARRKLPQDVVCIYCPIDFWWAVRHALRLVRPRTLVIFEVEIWPNLIRQARRLGAKVVLANGRMSDKSSAGYARWRCFFAPLFRTFDLLCVQTPEDARRMEAVIGPDPRLLVCDTMKFDQVPDRDGADKTAVLDDAFGAVPGRLVFTAGSTHTGEEELICQAFAALAREFPALRLVLVPRHQERGADVLAVVRKHGLTARLLQGGDGDEPPVQVLIVNTSGDLMNFYAACDLAYVGKSLAGQTGGHNMIEPAIFGKPVLYGRHVENFRQVAEIFRNRQAAIEIQEDDGLLPALHGLLADPAERAALGRRARQLVEDCRGAIDRTLDAIENLRK